MSGGFPRPSRSSLRRARVDAWSRTRGPLPWSRRVPLSATPWGVAHWLARCLALTSPPRGAPRAPPLARSAPHSCGFGACHDLVLACLYSCAPGGACGEAARPPLALRRAAATAPSGGLGLEPACAFHLEPSWHQGSKALTHSLRPWSWNAQEKLERVRSYLVLCVPPRA
jgi:hypothetical protein